MLEVAFLKKKKKLSHNASVISFANTDLNRSDGHKNIHQFNFLAPTLNLSGEDRRCSRNQVEISALRLSLQFFFSNFIEYQVLHLFSFYGLTHLFTISVFSWLRFPSPDSVFCLCLWINRCTKNLVLRQSLRTESSRM